MSKELTPLEAINNIRKMVNDVQYASKIPTIDNELNIIETALKVLEIIKELFDIEFITIKHFKTFYTMRLTNKTTNYVQNIDIKTKEKFDLLKEVFNGTR